MINKKLIIVFALAFLLNLIWENLHSVLYAHYQGGAITEPILIRAALFDAVFVTLVYLLFRRSKFLQNKRWLTLVIGIIFSAGLEIYALSTNRWAYNELMPVVPILGVGLLPLVQLGLLSYLLLIIL